LKLCSLYVHNLMNTIANSALIQLKLVVTYIFSTLWLCKNGKSTNSTMHEVALAVLEQDSNWLIQLRDDIDEILFPGQWGLFGGHIEPGETPSQAVHRELFEEISWVVDKPLTPWFRRETGVYIAYLFRGKLSVSIDQLILHEGQDMTLASLDQLACGSIWSHRLHEYRPIAPGLEIVRQHLFSSIHAP